MLNLSDRPHTDFRDPVIVTVAARESVQFEYNHRVSPKERNKVSLVLLVLLVPLGEPIVPEGAYP